MTCGSIMCLQKSATFNKTQLTLDSYTYVTTIPKGSFNISVTELKNNKNLLGELNKLLMYIFQNHLKINKFKFNL